MAPKKASSGSANEPMFILLMGVAGSGKSTIGAALAAQLNWPFRDADTFHPAANIAKMSRGEALTDSDRWPWLDAISTWIDHCRSRNVKAIVSCSALKRSYRDRLIKGHTDVCLVYLKGDKALIQKRMAARADHFMPTGLLDSQFATLEAPGDNECPLVVSIDAQPGEICKTIIERFVDRVS